MFRRIPIFSYHAIVSEGQVDLPPQWSHCHAISSRAFCDQLDMLAAEGWRIISPEALTRSSLPRKSVVITFDDGQSCDMHAAEELHRRGATAAFFVTWSHIGCRFFLDRNHILELARQGFTIGSHGMTHARFCDLNPRDLHEELAGSRQRLESLLGKPVTALAIPFGAYNGTVISAAIAAGYRPIMTSDFALGVPGNWVFPRLTITPRTTLEDFRNLLTDNRIRIAQRRVVNGIYRRLIRIRSFTAGEA